MKFTQTKLLDAYVIELDKREDSRGFFSRTFCAHEFEAVGLETHIVQANMSLSRKKGTLRGMHYQKPPHAETKLVRCTQGAVYDVIIDLRKSSATYKQWLGIELSAANHTMLYVPKGFAHGFVTLMDDSEVSYEVSAFYEPTAEGGVRYNDPEINITWPVPITNISDKDAAIADFI